MPMTKSDPLGPPPDDEVLAAMAKAVAHPARLAILQLLTHRETCVTGDVVDELPLAQSTVSEHLRILREAGLIQGEIEGPRTRYCVNANGLAMLKAGINALCRTRAAGRKASVGCIAREIDEE